MDAHRSVWHRCNDPFFLFLHRICTSFLTLLKKALEGTPEKGLVPRPVLVASVGPRLPAALSPGPGLGDGWCARGHFLNPGHVLDTVLTVTRSPRLTLALQRHQEPPFAEEGIEARLVVVGNPGSKICAPRSRVASEQG